MAKTADLKEIFLELQTQMIDKLSTNRKILKHAPTKGDASELNWIKWLKEYLPKRYKVDKAFLIDCNNNLSDQIDVVVYDQQYTPFVFNQDGAIYIPVESVYAIFEVKQDLSKDYIIYAGKKAASVRALHRTSAHVYHVDGCSPPKKHAPIIAGILSLSSSWNPPLGESFEKCILGLTNNQRLDFGCALEHGSFMVNYGDETKIEKSTKEEALIFFFLKFLMALQKLGTVPAIDIECYAKALDSI